MASEFVGPLLDVFYLLLAARVTGWVFKKFKQPGVIGEVLAGVLIGPALFGWVHETELLDFVAELGAIFLLFLVGIETRLDDILGVGKEAFFVAILGVLVPFFAGWAFGEYMGFALIPSLFLGTALVATSVGITARVLQELGVLAQPFSRIILGAAVIDDVLGLIVLAVVSGMAASGGIVLGEIQTLVLSSIAFVALSAACVPLIRRLPVARLSLDGGVKLGILLGVGMAGLSAFIGLAPIVGAFFAGMILAELQHEAELNLEEPIHGVTVLLTPIFFAVVGLKLDLAAITDPTVLTVGGALTVIAVLGKMLGGLGALSRGIREATVVGMGMVPRGEVGLIVAAIGLSTGAVNQEEYAIVLFVVLVSTLIAPLLLRPLINWAQAGKVDQPPLGATPDVPGPGEDQV